VAHERSADRQHLLLAAESGAGPPIRQRRARQRQQECGQGRAVCTSATIALLSDRVVMNQAAATPVIHVQRLPTIQADQSTTKNRLRSGFHSVTGALPKEAPPVTRR
jgi:hypothetical protein